MAGPDSDKPTHEDSLRCFFEREIERLMDRLYGTALRLTCKPEDAEDVVAEAVSRAWTRRGELREREQFEGWLFRILHNTFIDTWRRRRCRQDLEVDLDSLDEGKRSADDFSLFAQLHQPFLLWWGTPEDRVIESFMREDIDRAIDALPETFRVIIVLVEIEGYTYRDASELLAVPLGTVRSRLSRARSMLQRTLWECAREAGIVHGEATPQGNARRTKR